MPLFCSYHALKKTFDQILQRKVGYWPAWTHLWFPIVPKIPLWFPFSIFFQLVQFTQTIRQWFNCFSDLEMDKQIVIKPLFSRRLTLSKLIFGQPLNLAVSSSHTISEWVGVMLPSTHEITFWPAFLINFACNMCYSWGLFFDTSWLFFSPSFTPFFSIFDFVLCLQALCLHFESLFGNRALLNGEVTALVF